MAIPTIQNHNASGAKLMTLQVKALPRAFSYGGLKLPDIPGLTVEQVRDHYTTQYPELSTSTITGPEATGTCMQFTFSRAIGSKG